MSAENSFNIGDEVLFKIHDETWRQGVIVDLGEHTAVISWSDFPHSTSYLSSTKYENIKKITNN